MDATQDIIWPTNMSSGAIWISQCSGAAWSNASEAGMGLTAVGKISGEFVEESSSGGDTHAGGLKSESYPGSGTGRGAGVVLVFNAGLSYRLEKVSAVKFFLPGTCMTWNLNISDFNLKLRSLGFSMSSRFCFDPNMEISGLWSNVNIRFSSPSMKNLHFWSPYVAAKASP